MTVASEREGVLAQPGGATRSSLGGRVAMSFAQAARRLAGSRLSTKLAVFLLESGIEFLDASLHIYKRVCQTPARRI